MTKLLKNGQATEDPRLDRIRQFDERSRLFTIREVLPSFMGERGRAWQPGITLNQGSDGACVGFSTAHRLGATPIRQQVSNELAKQIYLTAQELDDWPGHDYSGTSVLAGMKAAKQMGKIREYRWVGAGSGDVIRDVIDTLQHVGPIVFGIDWYNSMMKPRASGLINIDKAQGLAGGHAICAIAVLLHAILPNEPGVHAVVVLQQSWGDWGATRYQQRGMCYLKLEDLDMLLHEGGEGAVPLE